MVYQETQLNEPTLYILAWHVSLSAAAGHPGVDRVFFIDAKTSEVIRDFRPYPGAITGTIQGEVFPEHSTDAVTTVAFEHENVSVPGIAATTDATGGYSLSPGAGSYTWTTSLEGPFVQVQSYDYPLAGKRS